MGLLRLLLAIAVVIAHSDSFFGIKMTGGVVAVQAFFIISGFYMTMILEKKYTGKGSYQLFLTNRFLRLYPIYWTVLILTVLTSIFSYIALNKWFRLSPYAIYLESMSLEAILFQLFTNVALFGQDLVMFLGINTTTGDMFFTPDFHTTSPMFFNFLLVPQAWSLSIELMFYLIAPFLVRRNTALVLLIIFLSILLRAYIYSIGYDNDPWTYRFFPLEISFFLIGTISFRLYNNYKIHEIKIINKKTSRLIFFSLIIITILYSHIHERVIFNGINHTINWIFYAFLCFSLPIIFSITKNSKLDAKLGELSYPIYISHILIISVLTPFISSSPFNKYQGAIYIFISIIFSCLLVKYISDPIERIRQKRVAYYQVNRPSS